MRFSNSADWFPISDGPHRIEQTASTPGQVVFTVPAVDVAQTIVLDTQPLNPEAPARDKAAEPQKPVILPSPASPHDQP
jgi:hypothetical protein